MNRVLQISLDIMVGNTCRGDKLAEEVAEELDRRGFTVLGACFSEDMTESYKRMYLKQLLKEQEG